MSATPFLLSTVTVNAESVDGPTPAAKVTWNTTVPPECVGSVRVEFRTKNTGSVVANYTTTNTSETEIIQTGLQCTTNYYITVEVTLTVVLDSIHPTLSGTAEQVFVGGKGIVYMRFNYSSLMLAIQLHRYTIPSWTGS